MRSILSEATQHINNIIEGKGIRTLSEWKLLVTCYDIIKRYAISNH